MRRLDRYIYREKLGQKFWEAVGLLEMSAESPARTGGAWKATTTKEYSGKETV